MKNITRFSFFLLFIFCLLLPTSSFDFGNTLDLNSIFTPEELNWIETHPYITVAPDPGYAPIEYWEDNVFKGISIDYLNKAESLFGLNFKLVHYNTWADILEAAQKGEIQVLSAAVATNERLKYLNFTQSYLNMPNQFYVQSGIKPFNSIDNLIGKKIGVIKGYSSEDYLQLVYPELEVVLVKDIYEGLSRLSIGEIDAFVGDSGQVSFYIDYYNISNITLDSSISLDLPLKLSIAVTKSDPVLLGIMDKVVRFFPESEFKAIKSKWLNYQVQDSSRMRREFELTITGILVIAFVMFLVILWNKTLRNTVTRQTEQLRSELEKSQVYETQLRELLDLIPYPVFSKNHLQEFVTVNETYARFFNMTPSEIEGHQDLEIYALNPNTPLSKFRVLEESVLKDGLKAHIREYHLFDADGKEHVYDIKKVPFPIHNQTELGLLGISVDITDIKSKENERIIALSRLVSNVAHQINTPLGNVISSASFVAMKNESFKQQYLDKTLRSIDLEQHLDTLIEADQVINHSLNHLVSVVSAFKSLSISSKEFNRSSFVLKECLNTIMINQSSNQTLQWETHFDDQLSINTYQTVFEQVVTQLVENAMIHGFKGLSDFIGKIDFYYSESKDTATLEICDNGRGIPESELIHAADPLYSSAQYYGHIGLGLSIATNMTQQILEGSLTLENIPEGGLKVILQFKVF